MTVAARNNIWIRPTYDGSPARWWWHCSPLIIDCCLYNWGEPSAHCWHCVIPQRSLLRSIVCYSYPSSSPPVNTLTHIVINTLREDLFFYPTYSYLLQIVSIEKYPKYRTGWIWCISFNLGQFCFAQWYVSTTGVQQSHTWPPYVHVGAGELNLNCTNSTLLK